MNHNPGPDSHEMFTNVFVQRWAYSEFANSGKCRRRACFVIDERDPASRSSINQEGDYQTDLTGVVVEVKIRRGIRISGRTTFSRPEGKTAEAMPKGNVCWSCHEDHAVVEHAFVQFYPTLKVARRSSGHTTKRGNM